MARKAHSIPIPARILGIAGLIPFFTCAILACLPELGSSFLESSTLSTGKMAISADDIQIKAVQALGAYGAVILSFLGGIRWGNLLNNKTQLRCWSPLVLSVVPSLVAWPALLLPPGWMLSILAIGFVAQYAYDVEGVKQKTLPIWFGRLRIVLTAGATISLLTGLAANVL